MKIFAHYDSSGNIKSLTFVNGEQAHAMVTPKSGLFVTELEGVKIEGALPQQIEALREIARNCKVAPPSPLGKLVEKPKT
jgi:hypothetical protein